MERVEIKPTLAKGYNGETPTGWLMSEKLDGVRAIWNGERFISRNGNAFAAPEWFTAGLPKDAMLDGELWGGRGSFQTTCGMVRRQSGDWSGVRFMVFDVVCEGTYAKRLELLRAAALPAHVGVVAQTLCTGRDHLGEYESALVAAGAEGVMLRNPNAPYEHKRTANLLKIKRFCSDEARVVGHTDGTGQFTGMVGALICKWRDKTIQIGAGLSEQMRAIAPPVGSEVTFSYFETTDAGMPRFPALVGVRDYE